MKFFVEARYRSASRKFAAQTSANIVVQRQDERAQRSEQSAVERQLLDAALLLPRATRRRGVAHGREDGGQSSCCLVYTVCYSCVLTCLCLVVFVSQEWIQENDVLGTVLKDSLHQPQYVEKLEKIIRFVIKEKALTVQDLDKIWQAQVNMMWLLSI